MKRLADDAGSSSDEEKRPKKFAKTFPMKATDLLAAPVVAKPAKKMNPLVKPKTTTTKPVLSASTSSETTPSTSSAPVPAVKPSLGGLSLLGSYSDSSSQSDSDN